MILNDLILPPISCARKAVNDFRSHFDNRVDGVENEVGYIISERPSNTVGVDVSPVLDQVDSTLSTESAFGGILSGGGSLNLSRASPLNFSLNFGLLQIWLFKLRFFLSSHLILCLVVS